MNYITQGQIKKTLHIPCSQRVPVYPASHSQWWAFNYSYIIGICFHIVLAFYVDQLPFEYTKI